MNRTTLRTVTRLLLLSLVFAGFSACVIHDHGHHHGRIWIPLPRHCR